MRNQAKRLIASVLGCLTLTSCSLFPAKTEITVAPIEKPVLVVPQVDKISMRPVNWILITDDNYQEVFNKLQKDGKELVLFGLTDEGYERLSLNISDIRSLIQQQQAIIESYKRYYIEVEKIIDQPVSNP